MSNVDEILKEFPESKDALILDEVFNNCILRFENGVFVYQAECVIDVLVEEFKEAIQNGIMDLYGDLDLDESASTYAIEHFEYNIEGSKGGKYPVYEYSDEEDEYECMH